MLCKNKEEKVLNSEARKIRDILITYFSQNKIVEIISNIIDESYIVNFKSIRAKKFLNKNQPLFLLIIDWDKMNEKYTIKPKELIVNFKLSVIRNEIILPLVESLPCEISKEVIESLDIIVSSIFVIRVNSEEYDSECKIRLFI
jgi:hypothetical protein